MPALAENYWITETIVYKENFFADYITNPAKRFETGFASNVGKEFWKQYKAAYTTIKNSGSLILRAKIIDNNTVTIRQIYQSRKDRNKFISLVDTNRFYKTIDFKITETETSINVSDTHQLIANMLNCNNILVQHLHKDFYVPGITIGDPLKNEPLVYLT